MAVKSFNFSGANWSNPDPEDKRYWDALRQATVYKAAMVGVKVNFPPLDENNGLVVRNPQTIIDAIKTFVGNYYDPIPRYYYDRYNGGTSWTETTEEYWYSDMTYKSYNLGHQYSAWIASFYTKLSWGMACYRTYLIASGGGSGILGGLKPDAIFTVEKNLIIFLHTMLNKVLYIHKGFNMVWLFSYSLLDTESKVRMTYKDYSIYGWHWGGCPDPVLLTSDEMTSNYPGAASGIDMFFLECSALGDPDCSSGTTITPMYFLGGVDRTRLRTESTDHGIFTNLDCMCPTPGDIYFYPEYDSVWGEIAWAAGSYKEGYRRRSSIACFENEYPPPDSVHNPAYSDFSKTYSKMELAYSVSSQISIRGLTAYGISEDYVNCTRKASVKPFVYDTQEIDCSGTYQPLQTQYLANIELPSNGNCLVDLSNRPVMPDAAIVSCNDGDTNTILKGIERYTSINICKHNINITEDMLTYVGDCATTTLFTNEE